MNRRQTPRTVGVIRYSEGAKSEAPVSAANAPGPLTRPSVLAKGGLWR